MIAKDATGGEAAEKVEGRVGTSLWMRRAVKRRFVTILATDREDKGAGGAKRDGIAEAEEEIAVAEIRARGRKRSRCRERVGTVDVDVGVVHLLGEMVISYNLVEFHEGANLAVGGGLIVGFFTIDKELRSILRRNEIQLAIFVDAFRGAEPESLVANKSAAPGEIIIPAQ